ncbi:MAG: hypothetical protein CSA75_03495 [Sorangium cellulosum]|nr:MAG: hypothetical protein CSA75_03495 [Sorangium cellulosum]
MAQTTISSSCPLVHSPFLFSEKEHGSFDIMPQAADERQHLKHYLHNASRNMNPVGAKMGYPKTSKENSLRARFQLLEDSRNVSEKTRASLPIEVQVAARSRRRIYAAEGEVNIGHAAPGTWIWVV